MDLSALKPYLSLKDYSVSGEDFELYHDPKLDLLVTTPKPSAVDLGRYYESEDYISHTDARRSLFERVYHAVKVRTLRNKTRLIGSLVSKPGHLLDIGAGTGDFLAVAKAARWTVTGVEPNEKARVAAQQKGIPFVDQTQSMPDGSYDVVTMWHVLEHVPDVPAQIAELHRLLKPDGYAVIAVPNFKSFDAQYYGKYWAAYDVPRHLTHFSKGAIKMLFEADGFTLEKILPMPFDAFYVSLLSEKYKNGKMNFLKAFQVGWKSNRRAKREMEYSSHIYLLKKR